MEEGGKNELPVGNLQPHFTSPPWHVRLVILYCTADVSSLVDAPIESQHIKYGQILGSLPTLQWRKTLIPGSNS